RKRETRRVFLTPRLNLQFYYIPVVTGQPDTLAVMDHTAAGQEELCEVAGYLGRADPWYESNINTLCHVIPKLATMPSSPSKHLMTDLFITDVISYYVRMGIQPVCFQVYAVKVGDVSLVPSHHPARACRAPRLVEAELSMTKKKTPLDGPGIDLTVTYRKGSRALGSPKQPFPQVVVSDRAKELAVSLRSTGLVMKAIPADETEDAASLADLLCLNVNIAEIVRINNLSGRSFSVSS
ncbi:Phosphoinositide 3-kinase regulatory subunit 6, partial [Buceros rhinoceros silvestris]